MPLNDFINRRRLGLLTRFASAQVAVQAIGFLAGVVAVRSMEPAQYGYYTLALSMAGMAAVLGELGLASAVMAVGGRLMVGGPVGAAPQAWALGHLVADAEVLRQRLALIPLLVVVPACLSLQLRLHAPIWQAIALTVLVLATAALQVRSSMLLSATRLLGRVKLQQKLDLGVGLARLLALFVAANLLLDATLACGVNLCGAAVALFVLRRHMAAETPRPAAASAEHRSALWQQVRRQAPNSVYYVISSQVAVWLIGIFGSARHVAEVGALGRLSALFAVISSVSAALVLPHFARRKAGAELTRGLILVNAFFSLLISLLLALGWLAPNMLLWVLGGHYGGLQAELNWMLAAGTLAAWGGTLYSVGCALGWVMPIWLNAPVGLATTVLAVLLVDVSTVRGIFIINTATALAGLVASAGYLAWRVHRQAGAARVGNEAT
jgi:hypothetical protein